MPKFSVFVCAAALTAGALFPAAGGAQTVLAKSGAQVEGTLQATLDSTKNHDGDKFTLSEKDSFFHRTPALKGGVIEGHVEHVVPAGKGQKASMNIVFDDVVMPDGSSAPIQARLDSLKTLEPKSHKLRDAGVVVGAAIAGHYLGKRMGVQHGGLVAGAAAFALVANEKTNIKVNKGTLVKLRLTADLVPAS